MERIPNAPASPEEESEKLYQAVLEKSARVAEILRSLSATGGQPEALSRVEDAQREQDHALEQWLAFVRAEARKG